MKTQHKIAAVAALPIIGLSLIGAGTASARGLGGGGDFGMGGMMRPAFSAETFAQQQSTMFTEQAELLGIDVETVKDAWASGKSFRDLAIENGITDEQLKEKMKAAAQTRIQNELSALVEKGIITQAQADARLNTITSHMSERPNKEMMGKGMHGGKRPNTSSSNTQE